MYGSLREFVDILEKEGELVRVGAFVDPVEEMAEIADRVVKAGGKALLFENTGTEFPVVMNLFGSDRRMALALGAATLDEVPERIGRLVSAAISPKGTLGEKLAMLPVLGEASRWFPKKVRGRGECQQVVLEGDGARLGALPVLKCWPADGGRFVTLPMVNTVDPDTGIRNVGMYRMQLFGDRETGMHWHMHKTGARQPRGGTGYYRAYIFLAYGFRTQVAYFTRGKYDESRGESKTRYRPRNIHAFAAHLESGGGFCANRPAQ